MTVTIVLSITDQPDQHIVVSDDALDDVRFDFNPSLSRDVTLIKALSAGLLTVCQKPNGKTGRWMAIARTHIETAQMFAVKAATFLTAAASPEPERTVPRRDYGKDRQQEQAT